MHLVYYSKVEGYYELQILNLFAKISVNSSTAKKKKQTFKIMC